ncbi:MAG: YicC/YloC family endoribonuclease [Pseudomonadota bacterium]
MILSMTGFARREATLSTGSLVCELRSVNHRYLEAGLRLPDELRALEGEFRAQLQRELRRGKVDCTLTFRSSTQGNRQLEIDATALAQLTARLDELAKALHSDRVQNRVDLIDLLRFPGVLRDVAADPEPLLAAARQIFGEAIRDLVEMRTSEGARLAELLVTRCAALDALVVKLRTRLPEVHAHIRTRFNERLAELTAQLNPERLEQEIALLLQRLDVAEEMDRLVGHLTETRKIIASSEAAGRRLDFLMQEFNREANTLSSKSQDLETTRAAVDMKVLIEQMREQVQNIE